MSALVDFHPPGDAGPGRIRLAFGSPREVLRASTLAEVIPLLKAVHEHVLQGRWCVGFVRYEAAPAFDKAMPVHPADGPLAWFAVHDEPVAWPAQAAADPDADPRMQWQAPLARPAFEHAVGTIHKAIAEGEVYQVNFTSQWTSTRADPADASTSLRLFDALRRAQPRAYAAWLDTGDEQVLSVSPELFFDWHDGRILTRPMKGTAARGATQEDDAAAAAHLRSSAKERAENVMIVDLLRNDLSRLAQPHSVKVERLLDVTALPTVWQMTSDVSAMTREGTTLADVFTALFPCGSVTGAPKVSAMRQIHALEGGPRGVYCGAIGVVQPGGHATFNVPIRTVAMHADGASCGIGSGVTIDAHAEGEWREWRGKRAFLERASAPFQILETLAIESGVARNGPMHLERMAGAAAHFGFPFEPAKARECLERLSGEHGQGTWRARLVLDRLGRIDGQAFAMPATPARVRLQLAQGPMAESHGEFVRFKTTRRGHYDAFTPAHANVFDTLLWNEDGELTECTRGNIAFRIDGRWVTPPVRCGLLPGVGRAWFLAQGRLSEGVVRLDELHRVEALAFVNSLRGWVEAELVCQP